ncbi:hypothetical protein [Sphingomonas adhaesiva]|uniref:hypothetical protein n=1 Tax=Sphingomonas adhaesiva TaxID=28212 RepID=UPI002FF4F7B5
MIAAIDLADRGSLVSDLLHSDLIVRQFADYVEPFFPERASSGWQPLWFLSNDGLWTFFRKGKPLDRGSFENGMPRTKKKLFEKFDSQSVSPGYKALWDAPETRKILRDQMLLMLAGDAETQSLVAPLLDAAHFSSPERWPDEKEVAAYLDGLRDQQDLFATPLPPAAAKSQAIAAGDALANFNVESLPPPTSIGPSFETDGIDPVALSVDTRPIGVVQRDVYLILRTKCASLRQAVPAISNSAPQLRNAIDHLSVALQAEPEVANGHVIWSHANTLRRLGDADLRARASPNPDMLPLPEDIGELLTDLVEQFNVYAQSDPLLRQLDLARIGPAGRAELIARLEAGRQFVAAAQTAPQVIEPEAATVLATATRVAESAIETVGVNADQAIANSVEMQQNGARALLRSAVLEFKKWFGKTKDARKSLTEGALKQAGAETVKQLPFLQFINQTAKYLRELWRGQDGSTIIDRVLEWFRHLGS